MKKAGIKKAKPDKKKSLKKKVGKNAKKEVISESKITKTKKKAKK